MKNVKEVIIITRPSKAVEPKYRRHQISLSISDQTYEIQKRLDVKSYVI